MTRTPSFFANELLRRYVLLRAHGFKALDLFLIENILTVFNVSTYALEMVYGLILVIAIVLNTQLTSLWKGSPVGRKGAKA